MKIVHVALLSFLSSSANAFTTTTLPYSSSLSTTTKKSFVKIAASSTTDDEIAQLKAAAAKAREDAARLAVELGKDPEEVLKEDGAPAQKEPITVEEVSSKISNIQFEQDDAASQSQKLDSLVEEGSLSLWRSAAVDQGMRTYPVSLQFLESRTNGKINGDSLGITGDGNREVSLNDFQDATIKVVVGSSVVAVASLAFLPENVGATICYFVALIPILFIGIGSVAPAIIANAITALRSIAGGTVEEEDDRMDRIVRHESAHLLCGYLCGLPVKEYTLMEDTGIPSVEFHSSRTGNDDDVTRGREYTPDEIATLSVVAMSGSVGEILKYNAAKGGENDLIGLQGVFRQSEEFIGANKQQELTRWGALTAYELLNKNADTYEELVKAVRAKKSVSECIAIIESR